PTRDRHPARAAGATRRAHRLLPTPRSQPPRARLGSRPEACHHHPSPGFLPRHLYVVGNESSTCRTLRPSASGVKGFWRYAMPESRIPYLQKRSEEHTSELQSLAYLVCRLLLEKKNNEDMASL